MPEPISVTGAQPEALMLDGTHCTGVRYRVGNTTREARAGREVVVSAGTINSPQLLELSGIGQPERLRELGIEVRHALPGVGENLRDHYAPRTRWSVGKKGVTFNDRGRGLGLVNQALRYALLRQGLLAMVGAPLRAFVRSREGLEAPDVMLGWVPMLTEPGPKGPRISSQSGFTCYAHPMRPESRGHIHIVSADPRRPPAINFNFLSAEIDTEITVRAVRIARAIRPLRPWRRCWSAKSHPGRPDRRRRNPRLGQERGGDDLPSGRNLQDGVRRNSRRRCRASGARHRGASGSRRLDHAHPDVGQYQRTLDHDRRKSGGHGSESGRRIVVEPGLLAASPTQSR